ncbi:cation:dicarboxylase symporter family transporter [Streptomyces sp. Edi4]|uniref:cation:dicarboxylate symporter family transporter n=1 Tax=Streptomyces sp. Edi4 TaxID=3162527 RepID=UPI0033067B46
MSRNDAAPGTDHRSTTPHPPAAVPLYVQCLIGVLAGAVVGWLWPSFGAELKPLGDGFIARLMMIAPVIFCTVVHGIASMGNARAVGRVSLKALLYFEVLTTVAMVIGLVVVNVVQPGSGLHVDTSTLSTKGLPPEATASHESFSAFVLAMISDTLLSAMTGHEILPVLVVSVLFGFGLNAGGEAGAGIAQGIEKLSRILFTLIRWIMRLALIGAFGLDGLHHRQLRPADPHLFLPWSAPSGSPPCSSSWSSSVRSCASTACACCPSSATSRKSR